jgi:glycine cleavage system H protein
MPNLAPEETAMSSGFLPAGSRLCVWMAAGLVAYKLCDRDFDCDACPFDAVMRGQAPGAPVPRSSPESPAPGLPVPSALLMSSVQPAPGALLFPADRGYHPTHTWVKVGERNLVRIGLDAMATWLAGDASAVVLPVEGTLVAPGAAGCWLVDQSGTLPLRMPVTGTVARANALLRNHPRLVITDPYGSGWLVEVACPAPESLAGLESAAQARARAEDELRAFESALAALAARGRGEVGATLADGGERLRDWRRILGPVRFRREVLRLIG